MGGLKERAHLPTYEDVYVVSDLHLGGFLGEFGSDRRDYRIFQESKALAWLVTSLPKDKRVALVLNGDIVDFLADRKATYFDWEGALDKLMTAMQDADQKSVWEALRDYVTKGVGDLVLVLGNHDLELSLPELQEHLRNYLTSGDPKSYGRVLLAMDGCGFACRVGEATVLCLHGNEGDPWNAIDYGRLSLIRRALARGSLERNRKILTGWIPCPGTQMVIEYMNDVKRQYQWVDLLKPEEEGAAMVIAAIARMPGLAKFVELQLGQMENARKLKAGFLGADGSGETFDDGPLYHQSHAAPEADELMRDALEQLARGSRATELVDEDEFLLSKLDIAVTTQMLKRRPQSLREVLARTLANDRTFATTTEDDVFDELDALCGPGIDFLIAGHTHLARALPRKRQRGYYFNSGTWIQLMRIPPNAIHDPATFAEVEARLRDGSMKRLIEPLGDAEKGLLATTRTVVRVGMYEGQVRGRLMTVEAHKDSWQLVNVKCSEQPPAPK
jgi:UDP-2,3-diacylglucosamine pyrophosphatase LpxH